MDMFKLEVGLDQGSTLSPFLFALVMDRLADELRQEFTWTMMSAEAVFLSDCINVICCTV